MDVIQWTGHVIWWCVWQMRRQPCQPNGVLILAHRQQRWPKIKPALVECLCFPVAVWQTRVLVTMSIMSGYKCIHGSIKWWISWGCLALSPLSSTGPARSPQSRISWLDQPASSGIAHLWRPVCRIEHPSPPASKTAQHSSQARIALPHSGPLSLWSPVTRRTQQDYRDHHLDYRPQDPGLTNYQNPGLTIHQDPRVVIRDPQYRGVVIRDPQYRGVVIREPQYRGVLIRLHHHCRDHLYTAIPIQDHLKLIP